MEIRSDEVHHLRTCWRKTYFKSYTNDTAGKNIRLPQNRPAVIARARPGRLANHSQIADFMDRQLHSRPRPHAPTKSSFIGEGTTMSRDTLSNLYQRDRANYSTRRQSGPGRP
ncbi:hypothetical protein YC2023_016416 [Brassica napus]